MFGKLPLAKWLSGLILLGYCGYVVKLYFSGDITLYTHPRYSLFSLAMCLIAIVVLADGLIYSYKSRAGLKQSVGRINWLNIIVVGVLMLALLLPPQVISSSIIGRKTLNLPSGGSSSQSNLTCPATKPASIEGWVYEISQYPINCYLGQSIELTGFVLEATDNPLPADMYYLGRVVVSCCVVDAQPYALPIKTGDFQKYPLDTWLKVSGSLQADKVGDKVQLVVEPDSVNKIDPPENPYDYVGAYNY
jgi:uncharacterized repeat protein (TIGR03943 family)